MTPSRIGQGEIEPLPHWWRVALALRCVERARRLIAPPEEQARLLDGVILRLAGAVRSRAAGDDLADAAATAYTLALDNLDGRVAPPAIDDDIVVVTCMVAHSAAFAAEAATLSDRRQSAHLVAQSVDFAIHAYRLAHQADAAAAVRAMRADLDRLRDQAVGLPADAPLPDEFLGEGQAI